MVTANCLLRQNKGITHGGVNGQLDKDIFAMQQK